MPVLLLSLCPSVHILGCRELIRSVPRGCVTCRKLSIKPSPQLMGQLPDTRSSHLTKSESFFACPVLTKYAYVRKPVLVESYVCLFVSLSVKAVHFEPVSDLTSDAFVAALCSTGQTHFSGGSRIVQRGVLI